MLCCAGLSMFQRHGGFPEVSTGEALHTVESLRFPTPMHAASSRLSKSLQKTWRDKTSPQGFGPGPCQRSDGRWRSS